MSIVLVFIAVMSAIAAWWLSQQRLASKPWLEVGLIGDMSDTGVRLPMAKIGLWVFLSIVCAVLAILISAYFMRLGPDWGPMPEPTLLWVNTGVLVISSLALQQARTAACRGQMDGLKAGLLTGGVSALAFLAGQLLVWRQLNDGGFFLAGNPGVAFFYLLTAVHGVHLLGGLVALGRTAAKVWHGANARDLRLSAELCAIYWHFLLVVWVVLFGLLLLTSKFAGVARDLADFLCGGIGG